MLIELSQAEVVSALYISHGEVPFDDSAACKGNVHILKFDALVMDIVRLCDKVGGSESEQEALWLHAISRLYKVKQALFEEGKEKKDHKRFATFHMIRVQYFMLRMAEHVSLPKIIEFLEGIGGQSIRYQECRATFENKMRTEQHHENILLNAATLLLKDLNADFAILKHLHVTNLYPHIDLVSRRRQREGTLRPL